MYQAFLERHRNCLPKEDQDATMSLITTNLKLMANGNSSSKERIAQSEEIARKRFHLRPAAAEFKTLADIYRKLVLVNDNFSDTRRMFNNCRSDPLSLDVFEDDEKTVATITVGRFTLARVEEGPITGLTRKKSLLQRNKIINTIKNQFISSMEEHCYRLYEKVNPDLSVDFKYSEGRRTARDSDELDLPYYRRVLSRFKKNNCGIDLVFCDKMSKMDRKMLMKTIRDCKLHGKFNKFTKQITVFSRRPSAEIVHDIVHRKHPDLCAMYDVEPPRARKVSELAIKSIKSAEQLFMCGSMNLALSEAASIVEGYESLARVEAVWIAQKFL